MKHNKKFIVFLLALSMLFMNVNSSMFAKEVIGTEPKTTEITENTKDPEAGTIPSEKETTSRDPIEEGREKTPAEIEQQAVVLYSDVKGSIYLDANKNKKLDKEETGLSDMEVRLYRIKEGKVSEEAAYHALTNIKGEYELKEVEAGLYKIEYESIDTERNLKDYTILQEKEDEDKQGKQKLIEQDHTYIITQEVEVSKEDSTLKLALYKEAAKEETNKGAVKETNKDTVKEANKDKETTKTETNSQTDKNKESVKQTKEQTKDKAQQTESLLMTAPINKVDDTQVGAASTKDCEFIKVLSETLNTEDWSFNAYYVGQNDKYHIEKTNDFSAKYQMEFHNSRDLDTGTVVIRIPANLNIDRDKKGIFPSSIAIPQGTLEHPVENNITPFNYYLDEATNELVFFNYKKISSGTNIAFQILYKNLEIMELVDDSSWSLTPTAKVQIGDKIEEKTTKPLTGHIDSKVSLSKVTKVPYVMQNKSYTPGIYTEGQLDSIITTIPDAYKGENFAKYKYVAWKVQIKGSATQPWELYLKDIADFDGKVVGFNRDYSKMTYGNDDTYYKISNMNKDKLISYEKPSDPYIIVVVAYPADKIQPNTLIKNKVQVVAHPYDRVDKDQILENETSWKYEDYNWKYLGDIISVKKYDEYYPYPSLYESWLEAYKAARKQKQDFGDIPFYVNTSTRGYGLTHYTGNNESLGERIKGASYVMTTFDDFLYAYPNTDAKNDYRILDEKDYYYSQVNIEQRDTGYDPWEDSEEKAEESKDMIVSAMFKDGNGWEEVAVIPWNDTGIMTYTFTQEQINRKPWRVKVEHESVNYISTCSINLKVRIQHDSPVFKELVSDDDVEQKITLENLAGVMGQKKQDGVLGAYFHDTSAEGGNYSEPELIERTKELYGVLLMRNNAFAYLTSIQKNAGSYKYGTSWNDANTGRVHLKYNLMAYDGYEIYGSEAINYMKENGVRSPGRNDVVFYDLLPYGVKYDPSVEVIAGRVKTTEPTKWRNEKSWDQSQVKVSVDSKEDIITNYNGTGRTMVKFHIHYDGADPAFFYDAKDQVNHYDSLKMKMWMESWGVSFGAYYEWKDVNISNAATNVSAFMPEKDDNVPLLGKNDQVMRDNGTDYPDTLLKDEYKIFGDDIDGDGNRDERTVLYANANVYDDIAIAGSDSIKKLVKADEDRFGVFSEEAVVAPGEGYTYEITVRNAKDTLKNIVVYDLLEDAPNHRSEQEGSGKFEQNWWYGTFDGVITTGLKKAGIAPIIYYNADRNARISIGEELPASILTNANGWYTEAEWKAKGHTLAEVKAVAVDMSKKADGSDFEIVDMGSVTFQIHMISPNEDESKEDADHSNTANKKDPARYAYNNSAYYSEKVGTQIKHTVIGNSVQVIQHENETAEVIKEFKGDIPQDKQNSEFRFIAAYNNEPFATQEYQLFKKIDGSWERQGSNRVYATEADGSFYLHADEKAVFNVKDKYLFTVEEEENPFWDVETEVTEKDGIQLHIFRNTYRPILYVQKKLKNQPKDFDASKEIFTFRANTDGKVLADTEYWLVDSVRTDGGIPKKLNKDTLKTDANGEFQIKAGDIVALFPGKAGTSYEITETKKGENWFTESGKDSVTGTMVTNGTSVSITNYYKWKDLYLTKELRHQEAKECTQAFTFQVYADDRPFANAQWVILNADGSESSEAGTTDEKGQFTVRLAGKTVKIKGFEAGKSFKVEEIDDTTDNYKPIEGIVEGTMPLYALKSEATIINDYILRPISVSKIVSYDANGMSAEKLNEINNRKFTMTISVDGKLYANKEYTITRSQEPEEKGMTTAEGTFTIKNGQTVTFQDVGPEGTPYQIKETPDPNYSQIFPVNKEPAVGTIDKEGSKVTFVNGTESTLLIGKEYVVGEGDVNKIGETYLEQIKNDPAIREKEKVTLKLEVRDKDGNWKLWPSTATTVEVTDMLDNKIEKVTWKANSTLTIAPWKRVIVTSLDAKDTYRLSESSSDQYKLYKEGSTFIEITQKEPANDGTISDTIENKPLAIIKNQIVGKEQKSIIQKKMKLGSDKVATGAQLVFKVEVFDGTVWEAAGDIPYIIGDDTDWLNNRIQKSEADGRITVEKTEKGYPIIYFTQQDVKINPSNPSKGTYRIVELIDESDDTWGTLTGYQKLADSYNGSLDTEDATVFINSNRTTPIEIAKALEVDSEQEFTFELKQIIRSKQEVIQSLDDILESRKGTYISYVIYDAKTNQQIGTGTTGATGEIKLKGNQYARLDLADDRAWTVSEKQDTSFVLTELTGNKNTTQLSNNVMLIQVKAPVILEDLSIETDKKYYRENDSINKTDFVVKAIYSDGTIKILTNDEYEIDKTTVPTSKSEFDLLFTYKDETTGQSIERAKILKIARTITLTVDMVENGVFDAETKEAVILNTGDVVIPETILVDGNLRIINAIGTDAFSGNQEITSIKMPDTITLIGDHAFFNCGKLTGTLTIPESVAEIGRFAFSGCSGLTGDLKIPEGVTTIKHDAFNGCKGFDGTLTLPDSLTKIEESAFQGCKGFTGDLIIPDSVTVIEYDVFNGCKGFTGDLIIPDTVTSIRSNAFRDCSGFTGDLVIPDTVANIGYSAFNGCSGFTGDLVIPDSVTSIEFNAFTACSGFTGDLIIGNSVKKIGTYAFENCSGFNGTLTIGNNVTSIEYAAFKDCSGFTGDLIIPDSITSIESNAFSYCSGFNGTLTIGNSVTSIGDSAFYFCTGFTGDLVIPDSITSIGSEAFSYCSGFTGDLTISDSLTSIESYAFYGCSGFNGTLTIGNNVTSIGSDAFSSCRGFTGDLVIPDSVTSIEFDAFDGCWGFTGDLIIPDSVTSIGNGAFSYCEGLNGTLTIGNNVTSIGSSAFEGCSGFTGDLIIPDSVTSIGSDVFYNCIYLDKIIIQGKSEGELSGSPWGAPSTVIIEWQP